MQRRLSYAALAGAFAVAGCGISVEDHPRQIDPPRGPFPTIAATTPNTPAAGPAAEPLYFVRADRLVAVIRRVRATPTLQEQVQHLTAGPTDVERGAGLSTALSGSIVLDRVTATGGTAVIEIRDGTDESSRSDEVLGFGQIVCTLTARPDVTTVRFQHAGQPLGVPRADGSLTTGRLTAADYAALTAPA